MSDILALESAELDTAAYLRQLAAEADGVEMLPGPRGNRLRAIANVFEAFERVTLFERDRQLTDRHAQEYGGG